jgi:7-carboxy-7-deazaguanine synthase
MYVSEYFYSIQGEGINIGYPTIFARLQGCSVRCANCDTSYSWYPKGGSVFGVGDLLVELDRVGRDCRRLCITGGEPLDQRDEVEALVRLAAGAWGYKVELETSGCLPIDSTWPCTWVMDVKCPSTAVADKMDWENLKRLKEGDSIVAVVGNKGDFEFVLSHVGDVDIPVFIHPDWYVRQDLLKDITYWVKKSHLPNVRVGYQLHKLIWGGDQRGV